MSTHKPTLDSLRQAIDSVDLKLITLFNERAELAQQIGHIKQQEDPSSSRYRPERAAALLRSRIAQNPGPLRDEDIAALFNILMSAGVALQQAMPIAFLGPYGTFSQLAVHKHFGHAVELLPQSSIAEVVRAVQAKQALYGVVPIENSTEGVVNTTVDILVDTSLHIVGEIMLPITHYLLAHPQHAAITTIYGHPQALAQCRQWLQAHYPSAEQHATSSTAQGALLAKENQHAAAIGSDLAAQEYELAILASNIADQANNTTRFLVLGREQVPRTGHDKTTLIIHTQDKPGALAQVIAPFAKQHINISLPTSRPAGKTLWSYIFYFDIEGHQEDAPIKAALQELQPEAAGLVHILGSYPKAVL